MKRRDDDSIVQRKFMFHVEQKTFWQRVFAKDATLILWLIIGVVFLTGLLGTVFDLDNAFGEGEDGYNRGIDKLSAHYALIGSIAMAFIYIMCVYISYRQDKKWRQ